MFATLKFRFLFSRFFAEKVVHVDAIELSTDAASDFAANLVGRGSASFRQGAVEQVLPQLRIRSGVAILDPPRSGLKPRALEAIIRIAPSLIAYVSCDPATLARDLRSLLAAGYRLVRVTPFDMFPQTYHVETCLLYTSDAADDPHGVDLGGRRDIKKINGTQAVHANIARESIKQ